MEHTLNIRTASAADVATIAEFNAAMALESEAITLDMDVLTDGVAAALADAGKAFYLLAEIGGNPVGQLMVTYEWSDWRNGWIWWVQSVYVIPERRRQGIYRSLYLRLREMAQTQGDIRELRLYVMRGNAMAKRTYESLGMRHSEYDMYVAEPWP